jgi:hypothetical protein
LVLGWTPGTQEINPITVTFTPIYINTETGEVAESINATGIKLIPIASGEGLASLKGNEDAMKDIAILAQRIDAARTALNTNDEGVELLSNKRGLRGKNNDGNLFGGKKSKSKKHPKSKKRKSVRRI